MVHRSRCISVCVFTFSLLLLAAGANAQDWFRTGTGLGVEKPRVAAADFAARADNAKSHSQLFTQVVRDDLQVSKFAHQFADEIISRLSGGLPGIASTQIAFVSSRTGTKEIWIMDYDGANQHPLTSLHTISLTPRWSPDASRIAFTCFEAG